MIGDRINVYPYISFSNAMDTSFLNTKMSKRQKSNDIEV